MRRTARSTSTLIDDLNAIYLVFVDGILIRTICHSPEECDLLASSSTYRNRKVESVRYARDLRTRSTHSTRGERAHERMIHGGPVL